MAEALGIAIVVLSSIALVAVAVLLSMACARRRD